MIKKIALATCCLVMLMLVSCEKEETAAPLPAVEKTACTPNRTVSGSAMIAELNAIANCNPTYCALASYSSSQSSRFIDPATNAYYAFNIGATISIADQTTILQVGQTFANANMPSGYHISNIQFVAAYVADPHGPSEWFNIYVIVTYRKCR